MLSLVISICVPESNFSRAMIVASLVALFVGLRLGTFRLLTPGTSNADAVFNHNETDEKIFEVTSSERID